MADFQYAQRVAVGKPQQEFLAWISGGVSMLIVPHHNCTDSACEKKNKFVPEKSKTFKPTSTEFKIRCYGGLITGVVGSDQVHIGGMEEEQLFAPDMTLGFAKSMSSAFENNYEEAADSANPEANLSAWNRMNCRQLRTPVRARKTFQSGKKDIKERRAAVQAKAGERARAFAVQSEFDGVLGLSFYATEGAKGNPFIASLINQHYLDKPIFTAWFAQTIFESGRAGGVMTYGDFDTVNCGNVLSYEELSSPYAYQYKIISVSLGEFQYPKQSDVVQGFGTWITGPKPILDRFAADAGAIYNKDGYYDIDCSAEFPSFIVTAKNTLLEIKSENLIIEIMATSAFGPNWHFGAAFTREYCTVFDIGERRIGFAAPIRKKLDATTREAEETTVHSNPTTVEALTTRRQPEQTTSLNVNISSTFLNVSLLLIFVLSFI
ncbi:eukaryotic aspartyl protease [Necator americanus]|uniref:Eukaryotic aspartyl protease n=1 Tax=Necator americanus TaxID=51031 RepID=W2SLH4_NECAM|nr:eukaryotic aspartyl protease [Necator americanus]ETN70460.1 eukaryotic aspartyl protease [Necator americanus]